MLGKYAVEPLEDQPGRARLGEKLNSNATSSSLARTIVATRLEARRIGWDRQSRSFQWSRTPLAVRALKPDGSGYEAWQLTWPPVDSTSTTDAPGHVAWPTELQSKPARASRSVRSADPTAPLPGPYDALPSAALRSTWLPPDLVEGTISEQDVQGVGSGRELVGQPIWSHLSVLKSHMPELGLSLSEFRNPTGARRRISVRRRYARQSALRQTSPSPVLNAWRKSINWARGLRSE